MAEDWTWNTRLDWSIFTCFASVIKTVYFRKNIAPNVSFAKNHL